PRSTRRTAPGASTSTEGRSCRACARAAWPQRGGPEPRGRPSRRARAARERSVPRPSASESWTPLSCGWRDFERITPSLRVLPRLPPGRQPLDDDDGEVERQPEDRGDEDLRPGALVLHLRA